MHQDRYRKPGECRTSAIRVQLTRSLCPPTHRFPFSLGICSLCSLTGPRRGLRRHRHLRFLFSRIFPVDSRWQPFPVHAGAWLQRASFEGKCRRNCLVSDNALTRNSQRGMGCQAVCPTLSTNRPSTSARTSTGRLGRNSHVCLHAPTPLQPPFPCRGLPACWVPCCICCQQSLSRARSIRTHRLDTSIPYSHPQDQQRNYLHG